MKWAKRSSCAHVWATLGATANDRLPEYLRSTKSSLKLCCCFLRLLYIVLSRLGLLGILFVSRWLEEGCGLAVEGTWLSAMISAKSSLLYLRSLTAYLALRNCSLSQDLIATFHHCEVKKSNDLFSFTFRTQLTFQDWSLALSGQDRKFREYTLTMKNIFFLNIKK
jgi:hypothetical protein